MKIEIEVKEGRALEESRRSVFLWAINETDGDELQASYLLGINIQTFRSNCAKYDFTTMLVSRKKGSPPDYKKHAEILKMSKQGLTQGKIAEHMGVTRQAVNRMIQNMANLKWKRN